MNCIGCKAPLTQEKCIYCRTVNVEFTKAMKEAGLLTEEQIAKSRVNQPQAQVDSQPQTNNPAVATKKRKMPWWFWIAPFTLGVLTFVPLMIAGFKVKNWIWIGLAGIQCYLLFGTYSHNDFDVLFGFGLAIYLFTGVRKKYTTR